MEFFEQDQRIEQDVKPNTPSTVGSLSEVDCEYISVCDLFLMFMIKKCAQSNINHPPGGRVGNMLVWHAVNPVSIPGRGIHSDSDDHYNGGPVSLDPQWHIKEPWRR